MSAGATGAGPARSRIAMWVVVVTIQAVAAAYFVIDGIDDVLSQLRSGLTLEIAMECLVALALLAAVVSGAHELRRLGREARRRNEALLAARGAMAQLLALRFAQWGLSPAERDVAQFALKGSSIPEIARMRRAAEGTVRSQLSQIYAKAGVSSQSMLIALFIEDLLDETPVADRLTPA